MVHLRPAAEPLAAEWEDPVVQEKLRSLERLRTYGARRDQRDASLQAVYRRAIADERASKTLDGASVERLVRIESMLADRTNDGAPKTAPRRVETFAVYVDRWLVSRDALSSNRDQRARLRDHVTPILGPLDVGAIVREDIERVVEALDAKVIAGDLQWTTADRVWEVVTKIFGDMCAAKKSALRVRDSNPTRDVRGPDRGASKAKQYLYPSEFARFVECGAVPVLWRRLVALAIYSYARDGELRALDWADVDLEHGVISITKSWDRKTKRIKSTKSKETRRVPIHQHLLPVLKAMHEESGGDGRVLRLPAGRSLARGFLRWLRVAGVTRAELHDRTPTSLPMTFHDLRSTGITWAAIDGLDGLKIMQRAGHANFKTTEGYLREAENLRQGFGLPFPALPASLRGETISTDRTRATPDRTRGDLSGTRGSNP